MVFALTITAITTAGTLVFSLHTGCPGDPSNDVGCDETPLVVDVIAGKNYWIRVDGQFGPYEMELTGLAGFTGDCDANGVPDDCELQDNDCNANGVPDTCEVNDDCNGNAIQDICDIGGGASLDCNDNAIPDECDILGGLLFDCDGDGVADICDPDCDGNGISDICEIFNGVVEDCNENGVPDGCDVKPTIDFPDIQLHPTGLHTFDVETADLNGDGNPDIIVANGDSATVSVLLNLGLDPGMEWLGFAGPVDYPTLSAPVAVAIADYDGDDDLDFAVQSSQNLSVLIFLNDGTGAFPDTQTTLGVKGHSMDAADLDSDGHQDLAILRGFSQAWIILNLGNDQNGTWLGFGPPVSFLPLGDGQMLTLADLNGDEIPDLLVTARSPDNVSIFLGNAGGFPTLYGSLTAGTDPRDVMVADLNGDQNLDIVVTNELSSEVSVLLNRGPTPDRARSH